MTSSQAQTKTKQTSKLGSEHKVQGPANTAPERSVSTLELQSALGDPLAARPETILRLQRMAGNRAVTGLIQRKVMVGPAHDHYEQEADRVAKQVMSAPVAAPVQRAPEEEEEIQTKPLAASITPLVQRAPEEEEDIQTKPLLQRDVAPEEEEIQTKSSSGGEAFAPGADFEQQLTDQKSGGQPLPGDTRQFMENRFGADFSGVRIHADGAAATLNRQVQAQAFTQGSDIFMGEGKYNPQSEAGKELLAHELTHTIQQGHGKIHSIQPSRLIQRTLGISGGKKTLEDFYGGAVGAVAKAKAGLAHANEQSMSLAEQAKSIKTQTARSEKEMLAAIANGQMPRYVARVNSRDGFEDYKTFGRSDREFVFATEPADLRGATPGGALIKVGWTKQWLKDKIGKEIVICILDTQKAVPTAQGDKQMAVKELGWPEIIEKAMGDAKFKVAANTQGIADDKELRSALEVCKATPVKAEPSTPDAALNEKAKKVRILLDQFYGANELYTGMGATMNTQGQLGVREVMILNNDTGLKLTPQNHVLESLGVLTQDEYDLMKG